MGGSLSWSRCSGVTLNPMKEKQVDCTQYGHKIHKIVCHSNKLNQLFTL